MVSGSGWFGWVSLYFRQVYFPTPGEFPPVDLSLHVGGVPLQLAPILAETLVRAQLPPSFNLTVLVRPIPTPPKSVYAG